MVLHETGTLGPPGLLGSIPSVGVKLNHNNFFKLNTTTSDMNKKRDIFSKHHIEAVHRAMRREGHTSDRATIIDKAIDAYITHPVYIAFRAMGQAFKKQSTARSYIIPRN